MSRSGKAVAEVASAPDVDIESRLHFFKKKEVIREKVLLKLVNRIEV